jgi:hypothetical protein
MNWTRNILRHREKSILTMAGLTLVTSCLLRADGREPGPDNDPTGGAGSDGATGATTTTGSSSTGRTSGSSSGATGVTSGSGGATGGSAGPTGVTTGDPRGSAGGPGAGGASCGLSPAGARSCEAGKTCLVDCKSRTGTCQLAGLGVEGSACTTPLDCHEKMACVATSSGASVCRVLCETAADCPAGHRCDGSLVCAMGEPEVARYCQ